MTANLGPAYELRALLRPIAVAQRVADCGRRAVSPAPAIIVTQYENGSRRASFSGVLKCGRQHSCPVCGAKRAAERAEELTRMMRDGAQWMMLTLTFAHYRGERLENLLLTLFQAWRRVRATRAVRAIFERRVSATARALEVTWSPVNGWHPHIHLLLRGSEWSDDDKATLEREWAAALPGRTLEGVALKWSTTPATYLSKLGAEVAGVGKRARGESLSPWQLAESCVRGEPGEREPRRALWREYQSAMKGKRVLELDERAKRLAEDVREEEEAIQRWELALYPEEWFAVASCERFDPLVLWTLLEDAVNSGPDPPDVLRAIVDDWLGFSRDVTKAA